MYISSSRLLVPAKSEEQLRFMQAVAHNKEFAKKVGVPMKVGKEYSKFSKIKKKLKKDK